MFYCSKKHNGCSVSFCEDYFSTTVEQVRLPSAAAGTKSWCLTVKLTANLMFKI